MERRPRGFRERQREGEVATRAQNIQEMARPLEGPGAEQRLARLRARFRRQGQAFDERRLTIFQTLCLAFGVFLIVVVVGLLWR